ncbi:hypothetical protein [Streptomyces sp. NPDC059639]|uniref:hypothetical protein n=1 Tax=Streptomyces sp. NPDC059639 TaxID=3346891 RepID=UPI0036B616B1
MIRHAIPPARFFSQIPNDILRHPRLGSDAVRLLSWQLSLPEGAGDSLSKTAGRAGIGKVAFGRAKRELKAEGFLHEWRQQGVRGLWTTVQLVSNVPLSQDEAVAVRDGEPVDGGPVAEPSGRQPAAGEPTRRAVGSHPERNIGDNPSHHPAPQSAEGHASEAARELVVSIVELEPRLAAVPRGMLPQLAALAQRWLDAGHRPGGVRGWVWRRLPGKGQRIVRPGGLLRYVLSDVPEVPGACETRSAGPSRVAAMRECEGQHVQALLFRPVSDEQLCRSCQLVS